MSNTKEKNQTLSVKTQSNFMRLGLYLLVVVLLNLASNTFFLRFDLTSKGAYSLSEASKKAVATLAEPLTIKAFFSKNLPGNYSTLEQTTRDLLEEYAIYGKDKFNFTFYTMGADDKSATDKKPGDAKGEKESNEQIAQSYSINPVQIQSFQEDEVKLINSYMGLALIHGSQLESIPAINPGENLEYKITSTIQKMNNKSSALLRLKDNIQVKLFLSSNLQQLKAVGPEVEKTVSDLNAKYFNKLQYTLIDPDTNKDGLAEAQKLNAFGIQLADRSGQALANKSYAGLVLTYGDKAVPIPVLKQIPLFGYQIVEMEQIKQAIEGSASKMIGAFQELGYLTDYGTLSLYGDYGMSPTGQRNEGLSNFNQQVNNIYTIKDTNLKDGISSGVKTLIIAGPKQQFSEYDLFQIDQFLMQGNSLALFLDSFDEQMNQAGNPYSRAQPTYTPIKTGLEELLKHYGVNVKSAYIMDENCYVDRRPNQQGSYSETPIYYAPKISDKYISKELPFIKNIKQMILVKNAPLELYQDKIKDGVKAYKLVSSSDKSWEMADQIDLYNRFNAPPASETRKSSPLAYLLEGQFTSYFKDKPIPTKPADTANPANDATKNTTNVIKETEVAKSDNFIPQSKGGKIFIIGGSTILTNNVLGESAEDPNALFVLNVIDHLNDRDDFAVMRSKGESINPLNETSKITKDVVRNFNVFVVPLLGLAAGLIFWFTWENRKKKIQALFAKESKEQQ